MIPLAVGHTATAVGTMADSGLVFRLTRGRLWIGVLATLLVGIVALNVFRLSVSASSSQAGAKVGALERQNSKLRTRISDRLSSEQVQATAAQLGLLVPEPADVSYRTAAGADSGTAAKRLAAGELGGLTDPGLTGATTPVAPPASVAGATTLPPGG